MSNMAELEKRIQALEDIEAIKQLKVRYMQACDDHYNPEAIAACFTEDGIWDGRNDGEFVGREAIKEFFRGCNEATPFSVHIATAPIIQVDGDTATGTWYLWMCSTSKLNGACWYCGKYRDDYVKVNGQWLHKVLRHENLFATRYEDGWEKAPFSAYNGMTLLDRWN